MAWNPHTRTILAVAPAVLVTATLLVGMHEPPDASEQPPYESVTESTQSSHESTTESERPSYEPTTEPTQPSYESTKSERPSSESTAESEPPSYEPTESTEHPQPSYETTTESTRPSYGPGEKAAEQSRLRHRMLELTNRARTRAGCPKVRLDPTLNRAALEHSRDMARHDFLAHVSSAGLGHIARARSVGYRSSYVGENVAVGNDTAEETFQQWMNSPGHRANILDCSFTELGVGYVRDPSGKWTHYWTQELGHPRK